MRVIILLALLGGTIALPRHTQRIVGATPTTVQRYPFMSSMQYCYSGSTICYQSCSGALISSRLVLSAAHCYYKYSPSSWRAVLGTNYAVHGGSAHPLSDIILHDDYDNDYVRNDIALLRLATPAVYSDRVKPGRIPGKGYNLPDGTVLAILGWDFKSETLAPRQLHHMEVQLINQQQCAEKHAYLKTQPGYSYWPDISDGMVCAGVPDVGDKYACQDDSGAPLVYDDVIYGIASWTNGCVDNTYPSVNSRVSHYTDWILSKANQ